ncbi:asparagine synthase (glutamine-hydrolyzing) [Kiloniella antarctica]|uniref:asparagine synthase (glutamine-hydrolyzing) n=1 Tax=Kiloniella antarctica TaxID=1550907 RepID=A0ABW5BML7_9PROT
MCGYVGIIQQKIRQGHEELSKRLNVSAEMIGHRGPDDAHEWVSRDASVGFGFRRLAIQDLSEAGRQPMASRCGRFTMVFNGEIYNHLEIRKKLEIVSAQSWLGHSDSETLLCAISLWGLDTTLGLLDGMFSIALWDNVEKKLFLVRDRFGEKPLYYLREDGTLYFASELKALPALGATFGDIDQQALITYFRLRYIPAPDTIYSNVKKVLPGEILIFPIDPHTQISSRKYWDSLVEAEKASEKGYNGNRKEALDDIDGVLGKLVKTRLASDTPLGTFLSGGIDSSLVTALAQNQSSDRISTYTIRFEDKRFNEADEALAVANHISTNHTEMAVTERDALDLVTKIPEVYDEPFADPSQLPTMLLCQLARQHVTVSLSGDGGDEFFGGYSRYLQVMNDWKKRGQSKFSSSIARSLADLPWPLLDKGASLFRKRPSRNGVKITKALRKSCANSLGEISQHYTSFWRDGIPVLGVSKKEDWRFDRAWPINSDQGNNLGVLKSLMVADSMVYLPDDLMVKVDRASMAASLEVRTPFLNQDLARLCWSLPQEWHAGQEQGLKCLLRETLYKYVPQNLVDRPKKGFNVPLRDWLRRDLKAWGDDLINTKDAEVHEMLDMGIISKSWEEHQKGANREGDLWPALMFLAWKASN